VFSPSIDLLSSAFIRVIRVHPRQKKL